MSNASLIWTAFIHGKGQFYVWFFDDLDALINTQPIDKK